MKISENTYFKTNKFIRTLISALIQIAFYLILIGLFEYILVSMDLSAKTPNKIIYIEAFSLYLLGRVAKSLVYSFKNNKEKDKKDNDENDEEEDENDEDFF